MEGFISHYGKLFKPLFSFFAHFLRKKAIFFAVIAQVCTLEPSIAELSAYRAASSYVFETNLKNFDESSYASAVSALFDAFEKSAGKRIEKSKQGKVGMKVYTNSGPGLSTPLALVKAVIKELEKRGYSRRDMRIVDMDRSKLRASGFLPKYSQLAEGAADNFCGVAVVDINSKKYFSKDWFYDNPLMPRELKYTLEYSPNAPKNARKSFLPVPLFLSVDFWINLPVATDMEGIGVCAALGNYTIWNMSNNERFLSAPANAPVAVAEVAAIPELNESLIFTILSFEKYQYVGGSVFNAAFTASEKEILLSANPSILDFIALDLINRRRVDGGFNPIDPLPPIFEYARQLNLGDYRPSFSTFKRIFNNE